MTYDEMRDDLIQLLENEFFPKWKERNQDSEGYSHVPIALEHESEVEMTWLCITRAN